eukprot:TRINITY_DN9437_c1_g1_i2.p1 TRINITY_DN9437_c1_g1~~TRINITY_DN9437_c1_g1_i2.p1  ORF type:complete len:842 (-),score=111.89 TRINITY_DN9437_c1_g1_i2:41-2566(-)
MPLMDWWGFLGTGIQSSFAWIAYNRDGFADNVSYRQNQKYQQKNYQISWIAIARDDIRDMMGISVNRINNYMIVATLILSVAAGSVVSVSFHNDCPGFIVFAFYLSNGVSLIFLMLAIMFGVKGQNSAFTNTMKLLTYQVRPENPAEYSHDYMKQSQWIERNGLRALFRIPGIMPTYNTDTQKDHTIDVRERFRSKPKKKGEKASGPAGPPGPDLGPGHVNLEDATPLESLVQRSSHTWYLTKFAEFMRLWHPYDMYSKYSMGLGIVCLCHASAYFTMGSLTVHEYAFAHYAAAIVTISFLFMVCLVVLSNFKRASFSIRFATTVLITCGPTLAALGAISEDEAFRQVIVPISFLFHFLFWILVLGLSQMPQWQDDAVNFVNQGYGFWENPKKKKRDDYQPAGKGFGRGTSEGHFSMPQGMAYGGNGKADTIGKAQWRNEHEEKAFQEGDEEEEEDDEEQGVCFPASSKKKTPGTASGEGGKDLKNDKKNGNGSYDHCPPPVEASRGYGSGYTDTAAAYHGSSANWPTEDCEFEVKAQKTSQNIKYTIRNTLMWVAVLWFAMFIWAALRYWSDEEFRLRRITYKEITRQETLRIRWPGTLFRPTAVACAHGHIFVSDGFRIQEVFNNAGPAKPVSCPSLTRKITDLSVSCDAGSHDCWPMALVSSSDSNAGPAGSVVDCRGGRPQPLYQDDTPAEFITIFTGDLGLKNATAADLIVGRKGELVSFEFSDLDGAWRPATHMGKVSFMTELGGLDSRPLRDGEQLRALSSKGRDVMLLRDVVHSRPRLEIRDGLTMRLKGQWLLPENIENIQGGCDEGASLLVLHTQNDQFGTGPPLLTRVYI